MRAFAFVLVALAAGAVGFFGGRAGVPDFPFGIDADAPTKTTATEFPVGADHTTVTENATVTNPRLELLRALGQPAQVRSQAVRLAMNAWLAADGAAAIRAARADPEIEAVAGRMMQLALHVYPQVFLDDPTLLESVPNAEQLIASAMPSIATFDPDVARALIEKHVAGSTFGFGGDVMLSAVDHFDQRSASMTLADAHAELESILAERNLTRRLPRLHLLISRVSSRDPAAAAELIDAMPKSSSRMVMGALIDAWTRTDPEEAARWLAGKDAQAAQNGMPQLAYQWGRSDFDAASAYADTLTGNRRTAFLAGLANAASGMSTGEILAWTSRYEDDPGYPDLVRSVAGNLARNDVRAALSLVEGLPEELRLATYSSVIPMVAMEDPQAAVDLIDELEDASMRDSVLPMVSSIWAHNDAEGALEWASSLQRGRTRDSAVASVAQSLVRVDMDLAIDAIDEIEDPELRGPPVRQLLAMVETDDEAIRLGRDYDVDRDAVLELRKGRRPGSTGFMMYPVEALHAMSVGLERDGEPAED